MQKYSKTSIRRRPSKIEASCFCFLRRYDSGEVYDSGVEDRDRHLIIPVTTLGLSPESKILKAFVQMT